MGRRRKNSDKTVRITREIREDKIQKKLNSNEKETIEQAVKNSSIFKDVIDVYMRLKLPLVRPSTYYRSLSGSDEDTIKLYFEPRFIFISSLCLICMKQSQETCESCGMVSYCTNEHKRQDWSRHRDLCEVLTEICAVADGLSILLEFTPDSYRVYRLKLMEILEHRLDRPLKLWEKEIVLYPRVCCHCHRFSKTLKCCPTCEIELFCENHEDSKHKEWCREFQVFRKVLLMQYENGYVDPEIPDTFQITPLCLPDNFDLLMLRLYDHSTYYRNMDCYTYCNLSHISTIPLTALYSIQISCQNWKAIQNLVVHVIGAEFQFECVNLRMWEKFFLHFLPNIKRLKLIFIGPELKLPTIPLKLLTTINICSACKLSDRRVNVTFRPGEFYHDFCRSEQFIKPNLICLFNPGLYRETGFEGRDTWPETIKEFCKTNAPVSVTAYTKHEIPQEIIRIKTLTNIETILEPRKNPFASIKPDRNFVSDDTAPLIYKNYYITIVKGRFQKI